MEVSLIRTATLPSGQVTVPEGELGPGIHRLQLGCGSVAVTASTGAPPGEIWLAPDVWDRLGVPYPGIRLLVRRTNQGEVELGPTVAVLYAGNGDVPDGEAERRAAMYFGQQHGAAGLMSLGFEAAIDWERSTMHGYVLDNRPGKGIKVIPASFPIPAVVRLTWSIPRDVIQRLRERTGNRTFNWVRNIGKWEFHNLLAGVPGLRDHLPATRLFGGPADLAAMLACHDQVFVKHTFSIKGQGVVRIRSLSDGLEVRHMDKGRLVDCAFPDLGQLVPYVRQFLGPGRCIVQQGIPITGTEGRALDFRVLTVRDGDGGWRCPATFAKVAPDDRLVITNVANGASEGAALTGLQQHHAMTRMQAGDCLQRMIDLCLRAARELAVRFDPMGMLGFDVAVEAENHRIWLLEANSVPGWEYGPEVDTKLARSQIDYAVFLTGFPGPTDRQPCR